MRPLALLLTASLAVCAATAVAQTDPASFVSGRDSLLGGPPPGFDQTLFTVPAGQRFVLTEISIADAPTGFAPTIGVTDDGTPRWHVSPRPVGGSSSTFVYEQSWRTGLVFESGRSFGVHITIPLVGKVVCWSGYLVPAATSAVPTDSREFLGLRLGPNPSHDEVTLRFELSRPARVSLAIFDAQGRQVRRLARGRLAAGAHQARWDGRTESGQVAEAGVYFARLQGDEDDRVRRLVRVR